MFDYNAASSVWVMVCWRCPQDFWYSIPPEHSLIHWARQSSLFSHLDEILLRGQQAFLRRDEDRRLLEQRSTEYEEGQRACHSAEKKLEEAQRAFRIAQNELEGTLGTGGSGSLEHVSVALMH